MRQRRLFVLVLIGLAALVVIGYNLLPLFAPHPSIKALHAKPPCGKPAVISGTVVEKLTETFIEVRDETDTAVIVLRDPVKDPPVLGKFYRFDVLVECLGYDDWGNKRGAFHELSRSP